MGESIAEVSASTIKSVQPGAQIMRKSEVFRAITRALRNTQAARNRARDEGRYDDADLCQIRERAILSVLTDIQLRVPVFTNTAPAHLIQQGADHDR